jgi:Putative phage serine protease XkdF
MPSILPDHEGASMAEEQRFALGIAYPAGRQPCITKGADGGRDYFESGDLELAAWNFMLKGQQHGLFHVDGTEGAAQPVESFIYRNPVPWLVSDRADVQKALAELAVEVEKCAGPDDLIVRPGDWCLGAILSPKAWELYKSGRISGWSPQGVARRRRVRR